jgi:predicted ATPase
MKLVRLRISNFRSFDADSTELELDDLTFLLGPNGAGKTAVLQALARLFSLDPAQRKVRKSDFHVPHDEKPDKLPAERELWIEADFEFPELLGKGDKEAPAVPGNFAHMQLTGIEGPAQVGVEVLSGKLGDAFDIDKLRPAVFTLIAVEEPENSLSPHYLGRVVRTLEHFAGGQDAQAVLATHSASLMRRVQPEAVRYMRLDEKRTTVVRCIQLPEDEEAHKFVREAVQAFPELYFSRFVVLGEGDSEEVAYPKAYGVEDDELEDPDEDDLKAVLGKKHDVVGNQYTDEQLKYFDAYNRRFKLGSKPVWHVQAMANLTDKELADDLPDVLKRLLERIREDLKALPE